MLKKFCVTFVVSVRQESHIYSSVLLLTNEEQRFEKICLLNKFVLKNAAKPYSRLNIGVF